MPRAADMGRAPCCDKASVKRGPWSPEEDEQLRSYVQLNGIGGNWIALPQKAGQGSTVQPHPIVVVRYSDCSESLFAAANADQGSITVHGIHFTFLVLCPKG